MPSRGSFSKVAPTLRFSTTPSKASEYGIYLFAGATGAKVFNNALVGDPASPTNLAIGIEGASSNKLVNNSFSDYSLDIFIDATSAENTINLGGSSPNIVDDSPSTIYR